MLLCHYDDAWRMSIQTTTPKKNHTEVSAEHNLLARGAACTCIQIAAAPSLSDSLEREELYNSKSPSASSKTILCRCRCTSEIHPAATLPVPNQDEVKVKVGETAPVPAARQAAADKPIPGDEKV
jgi:hypothetical protein